MDMLARLIEEYLGLCETYVEEAPKESFPEYSMGSEEHNCVEITEDK